MSLNHKNQRNDPVFNNPYSDASVEVPASVMSQLHLKNETPGYFDTIIEEEGSNPEVDNENPNLSREV